MVFIVFVQPKTQKQHQFTSNNNINKSFVKPCDGMTMKKTFLPFMHNYCIAYSILLIYFDCLFYNSLSASKPLLN